MKITTKAILTLTACALLFASCGYDEMDDISLEFLKVSEPTSAEGDGGGDHTPANKKPPGFDFKFNDSEQEESEDAEEATEETEEEVEDLEGEEETGQTEETESETPTGNPWFGKFGSGTAGQSGG